MIQDDSGQLVLDVFRKACSDVFQDNDFKEKLATIKQLFFVRDFLAIFGNPTLLHVYTADYAPSRALCYRRLFLKNTILLTLLAESCTIFCMGAGNGAELVGITAAHRQLKLSSKIKIHSQDLANYSSILNLIVKNFPSEAITATQSVYDVLENNNSLKTDIAEATLITAFFLLNELLATSKSSFVQLISKIVDSMRPNSYLLIVDSAGSFSELDISGKKYMCYQLMDHMKCFECVLKEDSEWYRYPQGLHYPLSLNNMRYFVRLYKKIY